MGKPEQLQIFEPIHFACRACGAGPSEPCMLRRDGKWYERREVHLSRVVELKLAAPRDNADSPEC